MPTLSLVKAIGLLVLLAALGYQWGRAEQTGRRADAMEVERDNARAELAAVGKARTEESRRALRLQEAQDAEHLARQAAQRDAAAARAALVGLRQQATAYAADLPSDPTAAAGCPPADHRASVLADLFGRAAERADQLAEQADAARIAGQLCEAAYESLTR